MTRGAVFRACLAALMGHWRRNPVQLAALLAGLAIATALWSGVQAINAEARASYDRAASGFGTGLAALIPAEGETAPQSAFLDLRRAGWPVSPVLEGRVEAAGETFTLVGIEPLSLPCPAADRLADGPAAGGDGAFIDFILPPQRAYASPETLADLGARPGETPALASGRLLPPLELRPRLAPGVIVVDIGVAQDLLARPGQLSRLLVAPDARALPPLAVATSVPLRLVAAEEEGDLGRLTESFHLNLTAFGMLAFLVGLFIVHSAIGLAFEQRLGTFRTLRSVGVPARTLTAVLLAELLLLALVAGGAGLVCGYLIAGALLPDVAASLGGLYGAEVPGQLSLRPSWWLAGLGMSLAGALAAAAQSLWRAFRLPVLAAAQPQAWAESQARWLRLQGRAALGVAAAAAAVAVLGEGLVAGFTVMAGLILAAALALPVVLGRALALAEDRSRDPLARWFWADSRQQLSGLSLALMALLLALGVNIGVGTMVGSFRTTFTGWLDDRLAAEVYLRAPSDAAAAEITRWLETRPEVTAILPGWEAETRLAGWPVEVGGFRDHATYRDRWPLLAALPDAWDRVAAGSAALVSEQMSYRLDLSPGDRVTLPTPVGPWDVEVAGVYADYGNPKGQVRVAVGAFTARFPDAPRQGFGLRVEPAAVPALIAEMRDRFGLDADRLRDQTSLKDVSRRIFERTFAVTAALNALTLGVAGVALLTSLVTLSGLRLPQIAPVWAIGMTQRRLGLIELAKMLMLALLTALCAIPLGLGIAWVLLAVVNVEAFGWRLPLHLFPGQWVGLVALAVATAFAAAAWPIWRIARMPPARLVQVFAGAR